MLRSRTPPGVAIRASTHQYHPRHLVYSTTSSHDWHGGTLARVQHHLGGLIPAELRDSYQLLLRGAPRDRESETLPIVGWMQQHGTALGFRTPTAQERARATGHSVYLNDLLRIGQGSFTERDLYDWTGNHFDPDAVVIRILGPLRAAAGRPPAHTFLSPPALLAGYYALRDRIAGEGFQVREHPVPSDLVNAFYYATDDAAAVATARSVHLSNPAPPVQAAGTPNAGPHPELAPNGATGAAR